MKIRYTFKNGTYSIYTIQDIELGLLKANLQMLKNGSIHIIKRDRCSDIDDIYQKTIYENDIITYNEGSRGEVYFDEGCFKVNGQLLSELSNVVIERMWFK